jgi:glycosyltransferase involved in cell wall biosynthesis
LILFGTGPQKHSFPKNPNVVVQEFMQPEKLGKILRESRALVLPSISDAWGLVVHEAALSGCALLLSSKVGSTEDFATVANAIVVDPSDDQGWRRAINEMVDWTPQAWQRAEMSSLRAAESHGKRRFADSVCEIVRRFG